MPDRLYLDHNATSPLRPDVRDAMLSVMEGAHNPSSTHKEGRAAKKRLEDARAMMAAVLDVPKGGLILTGGGTEADNLALRGMVTGPARIRRLMISAIEHDAVTATARTLAEMHGVKVEQVPVTRDGVVDLDWLDRRLGGYDVETEGAFLLCVMMANNETGVIQPVGDLGRLVWPAGGYLFVDAVQAVGKIPLSFSAVGADLMAVAAHKVGGPVGVGALLTKPGLAFAPLTTGGGQELMRRPGTENLPAIVGFARTCEAARPDDYAALAPIRDRIETQLGERVTVWGRKVPRLPNTSCFTAAGFASETQTMVMDLAGVAVSAGSACSSGKVRRSAVLDAMGATSPESGTALRVSLGWDTTADAADQFTTAWITEYERIAGRPAA